MTLYLITLKLTYFNIGLVKEQYMWLVGFSDKRGEPMVSVIRQALREYKEKHDK